MKTYEVYAKYNITPDHAEGATLWDEQGEQYLDLYGGHAVISIGHTHPHFVETLQKQLHKLVFYSNAVEIPSQKLLADKLGELSGYPDYQLFLCNSGAEANENALKLASFLTSRPRFIALTGAFHGRTSLAVEATDNPKIQAPCNQNQRIKRIPFNDIDALKNAFDDSIAAIIVETIQGVAGIFELRDEFLQTTRKLCDAHGSLLIADEVQAGYGRTGDFFAHQKSGVKPDLITIAKGMGNGFPIGGVLIHPDITPVLGQLGTTFGGNPLACMAGLAVLEVIEQEKLLEHTQKQGEYLIEQLRVVPQVTEVRGRGLMLGIQTPFEANPIRKTLLEKYHIFTGSASEKHTIRLLPPLSVSTEELAYFVKSLTSVLQSNIS